MSDLQHQASRAPDEVRPFSLHVDQKALDDLRCRLDMVRWPDPPTVSDWSQGVPIEPMRRLVDYWRNHYDWRRCEAFLNGVGQYKTMIDGLEIHFLHVRSPHKEALPILITHGWPGSVLEFHKVIGPLSDPTSFGGLAEDAFHVVVPSLPGFGFSQAPEEAGWGVERIAKAWAELMSRLGYRRYVAQGGDWGSSVTVELGVQQPPGLVGLHLNMLSVLPEDLGGCTDREEEQAVTAFRHFTEVESAYARLQSTRPQTIGYSLADSPVGQLAWIYEKLTGWSDCGGAAENVFTPDEILDTVMMYWLPNAATSSARLYWESMSSFRPQVVSLPVGYSQFPHEILCPPRKWAERVFDKIIHWNELPAGGHFAAFEKPGLFVSELRQCFRNLR